MDQFSVLKDLSQHLQEGELNTTASIDSLADDIKLVLRASKKITIEVEATDNPKIIKYSIRKTN